MAGFGNFVQTFPRDAYYFGGGFAFWTTGKGEIETSNPDRLRDRHDLLPQFAEVNNALDSYISARDAFLRRKLQEAVAMSPHILGDTVNLRVPFNRSTAIVVEQVAGFITDDNDMSYALIGKLLKKDGKPGVASVIATSLDIEA